MPRYFITEAWLMNTPMAPAMKNAGTRHSSTCSRAYHLLRCSASMMPPVKRSQPTGSQKNSRNTTTIAASFFHSVLQLIRLLTSCSQDLICIVSVHRATASNSMHSRATTGEML